MPHLILLSIIFSIILGFLIGSYIYHEDSLITGFFTFIMVIFLVLIFISVVIPHDVEEAKKEASWKCQFEECPYTYEFQTKTERDTVLAN